MNEEINKKLSLLEAENQSLKAEIQCLHGLLEAAGVEYAVFAQSRESEDQAKSLECIMNENISVEQIDLFITLFHGRTDVIGIYPMLVDETCYFIVFDFDNHEMEESAKPWEKKNKMQIFEEDIVGPVNIRVLTHSWVKLIRKY